MNGEENWSQCQNYASDEGFLDDLIILAVLLDLDYHKDKIQEGLADSSFNISIKFPQPIGSLSSYLQISYLQLSNLKFISGISVELSDSSSSYPKYPIGKQ